MKFGKFLIYSTDTGLNPMFPYLWLVIEMLCSLTQENISLREFCTMWFVSKEKFKFRSLKINFNI